MESSNGLGQVGKPPVDNGHPISSGEFMLADLSIQTVHTDSLPYAWALKEIKANCQAQDSNNH